MAELPDGALRERAGVSEECMDRTYEMLRVLDVEHLKRMWLCADPWEPNGALLRHQINVTIERKLSSTW